MVGGGADQDQHAMNTKDEARLYVREIVRALMSSLARAPLFGYFMSTNGHWRDVDAREIVRALGDEPSFLLSQIGYRALNSFAVINNEDIGREMTRHISVKDRLNLAMVAKQIDLGGVDIDQGQNSTGDARHRDDSSSSTPTQAKRSRMI